MLEHYKKSYELEQKTWTSGGKLIVQLAGLPKDHRLTHILIEQTSTVTNAGATGGIYPRSLATSLALIEHKSPRWTVRRTGKQLWNDAKHMDGKSLNNAAVSVTGMGGSAEVKCFMRLSPVDFNAGSPNDCAQPTSLMEGKTIEITCASTPTVESGFTISATTLKFTCFFIPGAGDTVPTKVRQDYEDWAQATALLRPGVYSHLYIYDESDSAVTTTEYTKVRVQQDGREVVDNLPTTQLIAEYNRVSVQGASQDNELEQLPTGTALFIPVITPEKGYKVSNLPTATQTCRADITGSVSTARWAYRILELASETEDNEAMRLMGVAEPERTPRGEKTRSKVAVNATGVRASVLSRVLPKRFLR